MSLYTPKDDSTAEGEFQQERVKKTDHPAEMAGLEKRISAQSYECIAGDEDKGDDNGKGFYLTHLAGEDEDEAVGDEAGDAGHHLGADGGAGACELEIALQPGNELFGHGGGSSLSLCVNYSMNLAQLQGI